MPKQITQFKLLVVTPVDVSNEMNIIQDTVESLNQMYGMINNADIKIQYWSFDDLNQNFSEFDAIVAVFWTQFGTTVEACIAKLKEEVKAHIEQVNSFFLYLSTCKANPLQTDADQYKKILNFQSKYKQRDNCWTYDSLEMFKRLVVNQLTLYFVEQLNTLQSSSEPEIRDLRIVGVTEAQITETPKLFRHRFLHSKFIMNYNQKTLDLLDKINTLNSLLADSNLKESEALKLGDGSKASMSGENFQKLVHTIKNLPNTNMVKALLTEPAQINPEIQKIIIKHLETIGKKIEVEAFFNLGNLMEKLNPLRSAEYGNVASSHLIGSTHEKEKYLLLMDLYANIVIYEESFAYLSEIDDLLYLQCALINKGNGYEEDIEVKLYFEKGCLCKRDDLPVPGAGILEIMNPSLELFFKPQKGNDIDPYNAYPEDLKKTSRLLYGDHGLIRKQKAKVNPEIYRKRIETYFCYEYSQEGEFDVLTYHLKEINQNTQIALPSYLVFKKELRRMKYVINSKHLPEVIQRELSIMRADR